MSPRPRSPGNRDLPPHLYPQHRGGVTYYTWRDPRDGRFHSLGHDKVQAVLDAKALNSAVAAALSRRTLDHLMEQPAELTLGAWIARYEKRLDQRVAEGEIKPNTVRARVNALKYVQGLRDRPLVDVDTRACAEVLEALVAAGKRALARVVRSALVDLFVEALAAGVVHHNPVIATRKPKAPVKRQRLTLEGWQAVYAAAEDAPVWVRPMLLLALVTGQRPGDVCRMKIADWDGKVLRVEQEKTGRRLALPGALRLDAIGWSLEQAVQACLRGRIVGATELLHYRVSNARSKRGGAVTVDTAGRWFQELRDRTWLKGPDAPSLYECRSLAKRLYAAQGGVDTVMLLGHKSERMGLLYADPRGVEYEMVKVEGV